MARLGLFGGTFDPIHNGHLRAVEEILEDLKLDQIALIPAFLPPHKNDKPVTEFRHRYNMCCLALEGEERIYVSDVESRRQGKSYSIDTLRDFRSRYSEDELFFITGMDAFLDIINWQSYEELFSLSHFIVISRPGYPRDQVENVLKAISAEYSPDPRQSRYLHPGGGFVNLWETTLLDISSTRIRQYIREGKSIRYLVPETVMQYIYAQGLYR